MKLIDLGAQQELIRASLEKRMKGVLAHGQYIMGPEVKELETQLAKFAGTKHAIGCSSGTDALLIALMAYGVGPGDAIFTTPFTFIATAEVIALLGATPVFADINPRSFNIDPQKLREAIEKTRVDGKLKPKGMIPVDLFGLPADYDEIMSFANKESLFVLQDAAQSFGALYKGKRAPALGHVGATSFFPAKPLGCYGDGGAIFTDDDKLAEVMRSIILHGKGSHKYENIRIGVNGRLDTLQAAILLAKLEVFGKELDNRQRVAEKYSAGLKGTVEVPLIPKGMVSAWAQYSILTERRDDLERYLKEKGIPTAIYYPTPLHLQPAIAYLGYKKGDFPVSEDASHRILSLPMHPYLTDQEMQEVTEAIWNFTKP
jgi:UDP-2-acetamido-2-deoxy-ribo-hexuluronate aminotransferase